MAKATTAAERIRHALLGPDGSAPKPRGVEVLSTRPDGTPAHVRRAHVTVSKADLVEACQAALKARPDCVKAQELLAGGLGAPDRPLSIQADCAYELLAVIDGAQPGDAPHAA